ncbi:hypothetical protein GCM10009007_00850 [Formosimonas limnophila]|uniref:Uncharacterized protein n=1 Tax=Formosimonas limnophila TaxID=1384487 RepID=A0A8J3CFD2_9BURK|nr:M15 family metallopeptidase [Formosimonas limnophila]GHA64337.1 hypothetical protein GCM10009007_00850 [Formosimonas limnophila]
MVDLTTLSIHAKSPVTFDIRYASTNSFTRQIIYDALYAFMILDAAIALMRVANCLAKYGYGLRVFDAYRPWYVTAYF